MVKLQELLQSEEGQNAMREDGLKVQTMQMLVEFTHSWRTSRTKLSVAADGALRRR